MAERAGSPVPSSSRLEALIASGLLAASPDEALDRYTRLARRLLGGAAALITLVDDDRQFNLSVDADRPGWRELREVPLSQSFCRHVVAARHPLRIDDARRDAATRDSPAIAELGVHAYLGVPIATPDGEVLGALCVVDAAPRHWSDEDEAALVDLGQAVRAEIAARHWRRDGEPARAREEALTLAESSGGIGVWDVDLATGLARGTPQFFRLHGLGPVAEPVPIETFRRMRHPGDRMRLLEGFQDALDSGKDTYEMEYRIRRADGATRWIFGRGRIVRDERGHPVRYSGVDIDITERKEAEAALAESEERLRLAQDAAGIGTWDWTIGSDMVRWSDNQWRLHGLAKAGAEQQISAWRHVMHPEDKPKVVAAAEEAIRSGTRFEAEYRLANAADGARWMLTRGTVISDEHGRPVRMLGVTVEITARRMAREALERANQLLEARVRERTAALEAEAARRTEAESRLHQAQKMDAVGRLTGGVAHDFNNLLTVIIGNIERLGRRLGDGATPPAQLGRLAHNALVGAQRASSLTQQLLAFSRRQPLDPKPLDPNKLVAGMSNLLRRTLGEAIVVDSVLAPRLWRCSVDSNQLEIAILNLAVNARDAMPEGGRLTIETANTRFDDDFADAPDEAVSGDYVVIAVTDTGAGMPPDVVERAFEPFFTTKEVGKGTGLGLSQVYGFVRQSGGQVRIVSEVGRGTSVKLYLPRLEEAEGESPGAVEAPLLSRRDGETVLVVEDDEKVRENTVAMLAELGYRALEAADSEAALALLRERSDVALMFTDIGLPGRNGRELAAEALRLRPALRVLFTTGYAGHAAGVTDPGLPLLAKPFTYAAFAGKLREALDGGGAPMRVLVVEDEFLVRTTAVEALEELGFRTVEAGSAAEALAKLRAADGAIDAVLIDVGLPDRKGDALAAELRRTRPELPIVIATGYDETALRAAFAADPRVAVLAKPYERRQLGAALAGLRPGRA